MNKLLILCGIPFSGKSTLAREIIKALKCEKVDLDEVKFEMFGSEVKDADLLQKDWDKVYQSMYEEIQRLLKQGKTVVHDTGNFTRYERNLIRQIADKLGVESKTIFVDTPKNIAYDRLLLNRKTKERFDVTDSDFESTVAEMEVPTENENTITFKVGDDADSWINEHLAR